MPRKPVETGEMDQQIILRQQSGSTNSFGENKDSYTDIATVWAAQKSVTGSEVMRAQAEFSDVQMSFWIRWRSDIATPKTKWQISWRGFSYNIAAVLPWGRKEFIQILVREAKTGSI